MRTFSTVIIGFLMLQGCSTDTPYRAIAERDLYQDGIYMEDYWGMPGIYLLSIRPSDMPFKGVREVRTKKYLGIQTVSGAIDTLQVSGFYSHTFLNEDGTIAAQKSFLADGSLGGIDSSRYEYNSKNQLIHFERDQYQSITPQAPDASRITMIPGTRWDIAYLDDGLIGNVRIEDIRSAMVVTRDYQYDRSSGVVTATTCRNDTVFEVTATSFDDKGRIIREVTRQTGSAKTSDRAYASNHSYTINWEETDSLQVVRMNGFDKYVDNLLVEHLWKHVTYNRMSHVWNQYDREGRIIQKTFYDPNPYSYAKDTVRTTFTYEMVQAPKILKVISRSDHKNFDNEDLWVEVTQFK